ncbi:YgiW/YdeI family stress tolerance OB fold protein [Vibrio maritimus]
MKKYALAALVMSLLFVTNASAQQNSTGGGFKGPSAEDNLNTVQDILDATWLSDGTYVTVVGKITMSLGNELYTFTDSTGSMTIEIDDDEWRGQTVTPDHTIKIKGEIDKNDSDSAVDVESIEIVQ